MAARGKNLTGSATKASFTPKRGESVYKRSDFMRDLKKVTAKRDPKK
jgi:hypothetical protein